MMTTKLRQSLSLLPPERRTEGRNQYLNTPVETQINSGQSIASEIIEFSYGKLTLSCAEDDQSVKPGSITALSIVKDAQVILNGTWSCTAKRRQGNSWIYSFEHPWLEHLVPLKDHLSSDTLLRPNRHRCFDLENDGQAKEVSLHLTEIKSCPLPVHVSIFAENGTENFICKGIFSFESESREINNIEISVDPNRFTSTIGRFVVVEYSFLGVRYVFQSQISDLDCDFGVVSLSLPKLLVAVTVRRFDRVYCRVPISVSEPGGTNPAHGIMTDLCATGASVLLDTKIQERGSAGNAVELATTLFKGRLPAEVVSKTGPKIGLSFRPESESDRNKIRALISSSLPDPLVVRDPSNYNLFQQLYVTTKYAPEGEGYAQWEHETTKIWHQQDDLLPGNYVGAKVDDAVVACTGTLPISKTAVFGHSWAMTKTLEAIASSSDLLAQSHAWVELLGGISHLTWCVRRESRFMARLHFAFEFHAHPDDQALYPSIAVLPGNHETTPNNLYVIQPSNKNHIQQTPEPLLKLISRIESPHESLSSVHNVLHESLVDASTGELIAYLVCSTAPKYFTAINMFSVVWCMVVKESFDADKICATLRRDPRYRNHEIDIFTANLSSKSEWTGSDRFQTIPILWYFIPKDDFGPILASMTRTVYSVLRKYGEEAVPYLARVVGR